MTIKRILNNFTGEIKHSYKENCQLEPYETKLSEIWIDKLSSGDYTHARDEVLTQLIYGKKYNQSQVDVLRKFKQKHFEPSTSPDAMELKKSLQQSLREQTTYTMADMGQLKQILHERLLNMDVTDITTFIDLSEQMNTLLQVTIQPFLLLALSTRTYVKLTNFLFSKNGFCTLLKELMKNMSSNPLKRVFDTTQQLFSPKHLLLLGGTIVVSVGIPLIIYAYVNAIPVTQVEPTKQNSFTKTTPQVSKISYESKRVGGRVAESIKNTIAGVLERLGAEVATLTKSFVKGFVRESIIDLIQNSNQQDHNGNKPPSRK